MAKKDGRGPLFFWFILMLGMAYAIWMFVPSWYLSWKAKNEISAALEANTLQGASEDALAESITNKLNAIEVDVQIGDVSVTINREKRNAEANVIWKATVYYPLTKKFTHVTYRMKVVRGML